jgi:phosphate transport system protein
MLEDRMLSIREKLIKMANIAEEMVRLSVKALAEKKLEYARKVIDEFEPQVNRLEIMIDEEAVETLALYHPEAKDLRVVAMIMKMVKDLERVGDLSVNIAEFGLQLIPQPDVKPYIDLPKMADTAAKMLDDAITAFISHDVELSKDILKRDDIVDNYNSQIIEELIGFMLNDPNTISRAVLIIRTSENMERIADQATNIAEYVIYIEESKVVKHHFEEA